jgi:predicted RNase H-like HicB family nuclease
VFSTTTSPSGVGRVARHRTLVGDGETYEEVRRLAEDSMSFAVASAAEDRGETFDEEHFASVSIEHYVTAPA